MIRKIINIDEEKCNGCGGLQRAVANALKARESTENVMTLMGFNAKARDEK